MKNLKAIELLEDMELRLITFRNHRDCTPAFGAYISEFLLNKEFYQALADERSADVIKSEPSELYKMFVDGNFGEVEGKTLYYEKELSNDKTKWELTVYHRDTEQPMNSGVITYDNWEESDEDLTRISLEFRCNFIDESAW